MTSMEKPFVPTSDSDVDPDDHETIRLGISACLLGEKVRYNAGHKRDAFLVQTMGKFVTWVPVCPEVEVGMSTPRETLRIVDEGEGRRLVAPASGKDWTATMDAWTEKRCEELRAFRLSGFVLKKDSPSCGVFRVKVYNRHGIPERQGSGLFAERLLQAYPDLPIEEEGRLHDPHLRENFCERVFAYHRVQRLFAGDWSRGDVVAFHTREKYLLLAHEPEGYRELGQLVARVAREERETFETSYRKRFLEALTHRATVRQHVNVLQHMQGYFREHIDANERRELERVLGDYRAGLVPLVVPITLFRHLVQVHAIDYLAQQTYLQPHPKELMLRNHA